MTITHTLDLANIPRLVQWRAMYRPGAPWLLDTFCGAGGAAVGYWRAGFNVFGVDIAPQPRYPFPFVQGDAIDFIREHGAAFDVIHASPPCQRYSTMTRTAGTAANHPDLIAMTRQALICTTNPYVIENVEGAPLRNPLMLCGTMFGLLQIRHRLFETRPVLWWPPAPCRHVRPVVRHGRKPDRQREYHGITGHFSDVEWGREVMEAHWMGQGELAESIPPAYTEYIGRQIMRVLRPQAAAA